LQNDKKMALSYLCTYKLTACLCWLYS